MNTPFEFLNSSIRIAPGRRVVAAEDYARFTQAHEILETAKEKARHIEQEASQAYEARRLEGYRDGLSQADDEKAVFCFQIAQDFSQVILKIENKLSSLFPKIVRNLLGDLGEDLSFKSYISRALQDLVSEEKLVIKVHSSKRTMIEEHIQSIQKKSGDCFKYIRVASDSTLEVDQATIETSSSIVVLHLQRQLDLLREYAISCLAETPSPEHVLNHAVTEAAYHERTDHDLVAPVVKQAITYDQKFFQNESKTPESSEEIEEKAFRVFE